MKRFYKVLRGTQSSADPSLIYTVDGVTETKVWNPEGKDPVEMGGLNIATEKVLIRWIFRGTVLYDVILPDDAEIVYPEHLYAQGEIARANKIIITNPRPMTDELALQFYEASDFPRGVYFHILAGCAVMGYEKTCEAIINQRLTPETAGKCLQVLKDFIQPGKWEAPNGEEVYHKVLTIVHQLATLCHENDS